MVVYLTDIRYREPVYRTMGKWLKGVYPVSTGLVVSALARPEWLVEIDATAVLPARAGMTFSLTARDPLTGAFGIVISSSSPAVAARCAHLAPGAGAVASQNVTNPALGIRGLSLLGRGLAATRVIAGLVAAERYPAYRQLAVVDRDGEVATFEGAATLGVHNVAKGAACAAAGNLLANPDVPAAMVAAYQASTAATFEQRLLDGLRAGAAAGGEAGPVRSAGLAVVEDVEWRVTDLRVDDHDAPLAELERLLVLWLPQKADYRTRGIDPTAAPSYGVPGDE